MTTIYLQETVPAEDCALQIWPYLDTYLFLDVLLTMWLTNRRVLCSLSLNMERGLGLSAPMEHDRNDSMCLPRLGSKKVKVSTWLPISVSFPRSLLLSLLHSFPPQPVARLRGSPDHLERLTCRGPEASCKQPAPPCQPLEWGSLKMHSTAKPSSLRFQVTLTPANAWLQPHEPPSQATLDSRPTETVRDNELFLVSESCLRARSY